MAQITLQGPQTPRTPLNTGDETPERGWWPKRIIDAINAMFTELYAGVAAAATSEALSAVATRNANDIGVSEGFATSDAAPLVLSKTVYHSRIETGGSQGAEEAVLGNGAGVIVGQRHLITLETLTDPADSVTLDDANFSQGSDSITAIELDAEGEFILVEWQGATWEVIKASSGVVTVS